jgi:hypothetical protein
MTSGTSKPKAVASSRWLILCHMWAGVCVYNAVNVGLQRSGIHIGALPAILSAVAGYYGSSVLFTAINRCHVSKMFKRTIKIGSMIAYFPAAILLAMLIGEQARSVMSIMGGIFPILPHTQATSRFFDSVTRPDSSARATSNESGLVTVRLPFEVAIDMPRDWWVLNDAVNQLIRTSRDAALDLRGIATSGDDERVLIAANSWPPETYAALRVTRIQPPLALPEEVLGLSRAELAQLMAEFETEMRQLLALQGFTFLEAKGIGIEEIGGWPAIVFNYRRSGPKGPVFLQLIQVIRRQDFLRINLSYREEERALWIPVVTRIKDSIRA